MPSKENLRPPQELSRSAHTSHDLKLGLNLNPGSGLCWLVCGMDSLATHPLALHYSLPFYYLWSLHSQKTPGFLSTKNVLLQIVPPLVNTLQQSLCGDFLPTLLARVLVLDVRVPGRRETRRVEMKVSVSFLIGWLVEHGEWVPDCKASRALRKGHSDENNIWPAGLETQKQHLSLSPLLLSVLSDFIYCVFLWCLDICTNGFRL